MISVTVVHSLLRWFNFYIIIIISCISNFFFFLISIIIYLPMSVKIQFTIEDEEFGCEHTICMDGVTEFNANQVCN